MGQLPHTFTQYTSEDGLTQKNIQGIIQDHKGLMWFATWDGLCKFDGYTFKNYKAHPGDSIGLSNNRLDNIKEDKYGFIVSIPKPNCSRQFLIKITYLKVYMYFHAEMYG